MLVRNGLTPGFDDGSDNANDGCHKTRQKDSEKGEADELKGEAVRSKSQLHGNE